MSSRWIFWMFALSLNFGSVAPAHATISACRENFRKNATIAGAPIDGSRIFETDVIRVDSSQSKEFVSRISNGSTLIFPDGETFKITKVLSNAGRDGIFDIGNGKVLRLSKQSNSASVDEYIAGYSLLVEKEVPVPRIISYRPHERVISERVDISFYLKDLFIPGKFSPEQLGVLKSQFGDFISRFKNFDCVGDFLPSQIAYSPNRGWMLLDWDDKHLMGQQLNPFSPIWDALKWTEQHTGKRLDRQMVREWWSFSNEIIAQTRGQSVENYNKVSHDEWLDAVVARFQHH